MKSIDVEIPSVGESITEVEITQWLKAPGDAVRQDEPLLVVDSDKASVEIPAPADGVLADQLEEEGAVVSPGDVVGRIRPDGEGEDDEGETPEEREESAPREGDRTTRRERRRDGEEREPAGAERDETAQEREPDGTERDESRERESPKRRSEAAGRGDGRDAAPRRSAPSRPARAGGADRRGGEDDRGHDDRDEQIVPLTALRRTIARRLVAAQQQAALLTTFNEIDMSAVLEARTRHGEAFRERHGVRLGLMPFFVRAVCVALDEIPQLNAEIRDEKLVLHRRIHIGVAVGSGEGLVVPVLRDADGMDFQQIEETIASLATKAREGTLEPDDLRGGTFTISNGGVYGSLLSTPIVNPPQSGVLGLHAIEERPVGRVGEIVLRPMMYVALTYDHRVVDGREAVTFLRRVKELVEDPVRALLDC